MSTRANILIKSGTSQLWFYRHSNGYPEGTLPTLNKFMEWLKSGRIRDNVGQAAGWLIILGHQEYRPTPYNRKKNPYWSPQFQPGKSDSISGWKVGAYEPTEWKLHGDTAYLYTIDLETKTLTVQEVIRDYGSPADYSQEPKVTFKTIHPNLAKLQAASRAKWPQ